MVYTYFLCMLAFCMPKLMWRVHFGGPAASGRARRLRRTGPGQGLRAGAHTHRAPTQPLGPSIAVR